MSEGLSIRQAAETLERVGARLYRVLAERAEDARLAGLLGWLAERQEEHATSWRHLPDSGWDELGDRSFADLGLLLAILDGEGEVLEIVERDGSEPEILDVVIRSEEDGLKLYRTLRDRASDPDVRDGFERMAAEKERRRDELEALRRVAAAADAEMETDAEEIRRKLERAVERDESHRTR